MITMSDKRQKIIQIALKTIRVCNAIPSTLNEIKDYNDGASKKEVKDIVDGMVQMEVLLISGERQGRGKPAKLYEFNREYEW